MTAAIALTPREQQILTLLAEGRSRADMAAAMFVSESTVKTHAANLYGKLGALTPAHAVALGFAGGFLGAAS